MVVEMENTGECTIEAPNGAEAVKTMLTLPSKGKRDIGMKSFGTCGSGEREAVTVDLVLPKSVTMLMQS